MSLSVGIVGLPNSGKSTLFNALLGRQIAQVAEYPYTTIEPNVGVVEVPDERLDRLADVLKIPKKVPAAIKFIDIAGLIKNAHKGEGLGNQFLAHIREVDAILHIVRAFENPAVDHITGKIDPLADIEIVNLELEMAQIKKPTIYVLNVDEKSITGIKSTTSIKGLEKDAQVISICAKLESDLSDLSIQDRKEYLRELGLLSSGVDKIIQQSYKLLNLITFFTVAGDRQAQAWPIKKESLVREAAQMVHTDFAKGFIVAAIIDWQKLMEAGSWHAAWEKGWIKTAGRDEIVNDGAVVEFKFRT